MPYQTAERLINLYARRPQLTAAMAGLLALGLIYGIHAAIGYASAFRSLYIIPIWVATRLGGRGVGLLLVTVTTLVNGLIEMQIQPDATTRAILADALIRFGALGAIMLLISQLEESLARYQVHARHDPLTGLLNRRALTEFAESALLRARRRSLPFTVVVIDCDGFKILNDQFGHKAGDKVLQLLAHTLEANTRSTDLVARFGGDEFVLIIQGSEDREVRQIMKRIETSFQEAVQREGYDSSLSMGKADLDSGIASLEELIHRADHAMYHHKQQKRAAMYLT